MQTPRTTKQDSASAPHRGSAPIKLTAQQAVPRTVNAATGPAPGTTGQAVVGWQPEAAERVREDPVNRAGSKSGRGEGMPCFVGRRELKNAIESGQEEPALEFGKTHHVVHERSRRREVMFDLARPRVDPIRAAAEQANPDSALGVFEQGVGLHRSEAGRIAFPMHEIFENPAAARQPRHPAVSGYPKVTLAVDQEVAHRVVRQGGFLPGAVGYPFAAQVAPTANTDAPGRRADDHAIPVDRDRPHRRFRQGAFVARIVAEMNETPAAGIAATKATQGADPQRAVRLLVHGPGARSGDPVGAAGTEQRFKRIGRYPKKTIGRAGPDRSLVILRQRSDRIAFETATRPGSLPNVQERARCGIEAVEPPFGSHKKPTLAVEKQRKDAVVNQAFGQRRIV